MTKKLFKKKTKAIILSSLLLGFGSQIVNAQTAFNNTTSVTINDNTTASLYPTPITVSGLAGTITKVTATLNNVTHAYISDISVILQAPTGESICLQSLCADGAGISNVTYTFSDAGTAQLSSTSAWTNGVYKPTAYSWDMFTTPAPPTPPGVGTYNTPGPFGTFGTNATMASTFNGLAPNGQWKLFIQDFAAGDAGVMSGGWTINIKTSNFALPVTFNNIMANCSDNKATVAWSYSAENNLDYFEIMESNEDQNFKTIGHIKPNGVNKIHSFQTNIENNNELNFYKIKAIDLDKKETFSEIISTKCIEKTTLNVYPTITSNTINIVSPNEDIIALELIDNLGNVVFKQRNITINSYQLNLNDMFISNGNYHLKVMRSENTDVFRITKN